MNHTILALVAVLAATIGFYGFVATQSAAAQFDTSNTATQSITETNTATATGGDGGDVSISQSNTASQQAAQSGAFGTSSNTFTFRPPW